MEINSIAHSASPIINPLHSNPIYTTSMNIPPQQLSSVSGHQCNYSFADTLMQGIASLILQSVANFLDRVGLGALATGPNAINSVENQNGQINKPSALERGFDIVGGLLGNKFNSILGFFNGGLSSVLDKAKDWLGKLF